MAIGHTGANANVSQQAGAGGSGLDGADGGNGGSSRLTNAVNAISPGGDVTESQNSIGGAGGDSDTGTGGSGGVAFVTFGLDTITDPHPAAAVTLTDAATGGSGGNTGQAGAAGQGGNATATTTLNMGTTQGQAGVHVTAQGGAGGSGLVANDAGRGGNAVALATVTASTLNVSAQANGGNSAASSGLAGIAAAVVQATAGSSGSIGAQAYAGNSAGPVTGDSALITSSLGADDSGGLYAVASHGAALSPAAPPQGVYSVADVIARPDVTLLETALMLDGSTLDPAFGANPDILASGLMGGAHGTGTDGTSVTSTETVNVAIDPTILADPAMLAVTFYAPFSNQDAGVTDISLRISAAGETYTQDFSNVADAAAYFANDLLPLGDLASGPLSEAPFDLQFVLGVTAAGASSQFGFGIVVGIATDLPAGTLGALHP